MKIGKRIEEVTAANLARSPVWQFTNDDEMVGELLVGPVTKLPVVKMNGRIVGTEANLATGNKIWIMLGNIDLGNPKLTKHFLTLSVLSRGRWFSMARYHDFDWNKRGPVALADFLELDIDDVFPISYDVSDCCLGDSAATSGVILKEPSEKLSRAEVIALAVP